MNDRFFLDTNIFIYTFDDRELEKQNKAQELVSEALTSRRGCISFQVVQEFLNVATQKFSKPLSESDAFVRGTCASSGQNVKERGSSQCHSARHA